MEGLVEMVSKEEQQLLNLSLSLVSHAYDDHNTRRKRNINDHDSSTSRGSSDGGDHYDHQGELCRLLQLREEMLTRLEKSRSSNLLQVVDQGDKNKGPYLIHLLVKSASSVDEYNLSSAMADLAKIYHTASFTGDSAQRVAAYFADGLTARFLKDKSPSLYDMIIKDPTPSEEFLGFTHLYKVSPCYQFSHFTANQAILEAFEREVQGRSNWRRLHVVDFDLAYGFQWPSLIQSLSEKATSTNSTISLRITGFARRLEELVETEARLVSFSKGSRNIVFEFQGLLRGSKLIHNLVERRQDETLAVNLVSCLHTSRNDALKISSDTLESVHSLNPSVTVLVQRGSRHDRRVPSFQLGGFMDTLHYYAAMFDSLDDCLPRESLERLCIERNYLGKEIKNAIVNYCFQDDPPHHQQLARMHQGLDHGWKEMMETNGFSRIRLSSRTTMQAKLLLRMRSNLQPQLEGDLYCGTGFRVYEEENGKAISIGWQDRVLMTASAWQCV